MNTNAAQSAPALPAEAGTFSLGSAALRVLPTLGFLPFNFAPVGGFAVFAGARVRTWLAFALPLAVMIVSDCVLWSVLRDPSYSPLHVSRPWVYGSFFVYVLLGRCLARYGLFGIGAAAVVGSLQFFLISNFGDWLVRTESYTLDGLLAHYALGIPFYQATFLSDLCFPFVFLGLHALWVKRSQPALQSAEAIQS